MLSQIKYILLLLLLLPGAVVAQELKKMSLQQAYDLAQKNYPVIKQRDLVRKTADLSVENISKGYLPQVNINGQATWQSDVTTIKGSAIPGINIQSPDKDQYKLTADVSQLLYDGGILREEKLSRRLNADVEVQRVEVELHSLKERINQLYFSILYIDEQIKQVSLVSQDLATGIKTVGAQVNNGVAFKSNLNLLKAEELKNRQRAIELKASRKGLVETLALFVAQPLAEDIILITPNAPAAIAPEIERPELKLFDRQIKMLDQQNNLIRSRLLPRASLFVQGGFGKPGLNMLDNELKFFYIGGLRLNWSLTGLYTQKREKELVKVNQQLVDVQKETFLLNTNSQLKQQQSEIDKWQQLVATDNEIIQLRRSVTDAAKAQLENGVITANDYLREVDAEDQARQTKITHQMQLLLAQVNYQTISGQQ